MLTGSQDKLAHCRGVRCMHLRTNAPACVEHPAVTFGSSAHGSLLRAKFQSYRESESNRRFEFGGEF